MLNVQYSPGKNSVRNTYRVWTERLMDKKTLLTLRLKRKANSSNIGATIRVLINLELIDPKLEPEAFSK
ncbi:hypothetical protein ACJRPK_02465 [Aquimarina sp. 2-A2]|uniref:hypothetical protein n=1 Tax=Aquimarina sp. 2-A2 TaxID=3382644 RepID=UPI00387F0E9C